MGLHTEVVVSITGIGAIVGWSSTVNGIYIRSTGDVCRMWAVIYRPEEAECEIDREDAPEVRVYGFRVQFVIGCVNLCLSHIISACLCYISALLSPYDLVILIMMEANQQRAGL